MSNANDFLFGGGGKAAKFDDIGDAIEGIIEDVIVSQQTSMEDNTPLFWADGRPREQMIVTLKTDLREGDDDDGIRKVYAKGGNYEAAEGTGTSMKDAIKDAVKKAGAKSIDEGAWLKVAHTGIGKKTNRGYSAPKLYRAQYKAPVASVAVDELFDD
jgi:hypothetical protein